MRTKDRISTQEFTVALLMEDITDAKIVSDAFRELGIFAHFYQNLDEFWVSLNASTPDLAIIDVKKMSQESVSFKNHPKVINGSLCYGFYYKDSTKVLLNSAFGMDYFGLIRKELDIIGQIKSILRRKNAELHLIDENKKLIDKVERTQVRTSKLMSDVQVSYNFENKFQLLQDIITRFGELGAQDSFNVRLAHVFGEWDECEQFSLYELSPTNQKLIAPRMIKNKYIQLPELWLSEVCGSGIDNVACEMAEEVAFDTFEDQVRVLKINGNWGRPDLLVLAVFNEESLADFQWTFLETYLTSQYRRQLLEKTKTPMGEEKMMTEWEAFSYLDDVFFHQSKAIHKLIGLNMTPLIEVIKDKHSNRFFWKNFHADFIGQLSKLLSGNFKLSQFGVQDILIFLDVNHLEADFNKLKSFVSEFSYWRYFEDSSLIMTKEMSPEVKIIAPSSVNVIRNVYREISSQAMKPVMPSVMREYGTRQLDM